MEFFEDRIELSKDNEISCLAEIRGPTFECSVTSEIAKRKIAFPQDILAIIYGTFYSLSLIQQVSELVNKILIKTV